MKGEVRDVPAARFASHDTDEKCIYIIGTLDKFWFLFARGGGGVTPIVLL